MQGSDLGLDEAGHEEVEDEYERSLSDGIEDEALKESTRDSFTITSYGADYPVDTLVKRMTGEAFFIPKFQRKFVWSQRHASRFIESLLMGLPVPGIFLYKEAETGKHLVVDGQQRLRSLQFFYEGLFNDKAFKLSGVNPQWEGKAYKDLNASEQLKLDDSIVHATVFQQDEPKDSIKSLYFVFERINTGGIRLSPQEIRNCISDSAVLETVRRLNAASGWRTIFGERTNSRLKDEELVLRSMAMISRRNNYMAPMRDFLNSFASNEDNPLPAHELARNASAFESAIDIIARTKGKTAFRPQRALNAAVCEAVTVGLAERILASGKPVDEAAFVSAYDTLLAEQEFVKAVSRATAQEENVKTRQSLAIGAFSAI